MTLQVVCCMLTEQEATLFQAVEVEDNEELKLLRPRSS